MKGTYFILNESDKRSRIKKEMSKSLDTIK